MDADLTMVLRYYRLHLCCHPPTLIRRIAYFLSLTRSAGIPFTFYVSRYSQYSGSCAIILPFSFSVFWYLFQTYVEKLNSWVILGESVNRKVVITLLINYVTGRVIHLCCGP